MASHNTAQHNGRFVPLPPPLLPIVVISDRQGGFFIIIRTPRKCSCIVLRAGVGASRQHLTSPLLRPSSWFKAAFITVRIIPHPRPPSVQLLPKMLLSRVPRLMLLERPSLTPALPPPASELCIRMVSYMGAGTFMIREEFSCCVQGDKCT